MKYGANLPVDKFAVAPTEKPISSCAETRLILIVKKQHIRDTYMYLMYFK